jgi:DNA-binding NarL/FixJ family response regulator
MTNIIPYKSSEKKITVFLVDDHELFRRGVRTAISKWPEIVITKEAGNGKELLELLEKEIPDVVILNITMPVMNGLETLPKIREKYPSLKVIILSMHNDVLMIKKMMQLGANSYLTKNMDSDVICQAIKCVHEYDYYYSDPIARTFLGLHPPLVSVGKEFTVKEQRLLDLLAENKTESQIADILDISKRTVVMLIDKLTKRR